MIMRSLPRSFSHRTGLPQQYALPCSLCRTPFGRNIKLFCFFQIWGRRHEALAFKSAPCFRYTVYSVTERVRRVVGLAFFGKITGFRPFCTSPFCRSLKAYNRLRRRPPASAPKCPSKCHLSTTPGCSWLPLAAFSFIFHCSWLL